MPVKRKALCMEQTPRIFGAAEEELPAIEASFAQDGFVVLQVFSEAECRALIVEQVLPCPLLCLLSLLSLLSK